MKIEDSLIYIVVAHGEEPAPEVLTARTWDDFKDALARATYFDGVAPDDEGQAMLDAQADTLLQAIDLAPEGAERVKVAMEFELGGLVLVAYRAHLTSREAKGDKKPVAWFPTFPDGNIVRHFGDGSPVFASKTKEDAEQLRQLHLGAMGNPVVPLYVHSAAQEAAKPVGYANPTHVKLVNADVNANFYGEPFGSYTMPLYAHPSSREVANPTRNYPELNREFANGFETGKKASVPEVWIVVKEHAWDHGDGGRPTLAYLLPSEFYRRTFNSFEQASAFIKDSQLPLGWVAMNIGASQHNEVKS